MINLPSNLYYIITDNSITDLSHKYSFLEDKIPADVARQNRKHLQEITSADQLGLVHQVHGNHIYYADSEREFGDEIDADGFYTDKKGLLLCIRTADCVPVLLYSEDGSWVGGAHAGWRGAKGDILANLYEEMSSQTSNISAIIGPSIHQKSYEVDWAFYNNFISEDMNNEDFFVDSLKSNYFMFDLPGYVHRKLSLLGITNIQKIDEDTYSTKLEDGTYKYPSYRRHCHNPEDYPRSLVMGIMIRP